ncbi:hypothetical protein FHS16_003368 [Paenibacillus endophyticus]|uniref:Uncharacterized protein n=1 Tax=Paenibacillus endophyticus TaxID=1294268 RepID=A0A7W5C8Y9_9BACL|nr:hypothetical protein [Paenibacillus endophyticus]
MAGCYSSRVVATDVQLKLRIRLHYLFMEYIDYLKKRFRLFDLNLYQK